MMKKHVIILLLIFILSCSKKNNDDEAPTRVSFSQLSYSNSFVSNSRQANQNILLNLSSDGVHNTWAHVDSIKIELTEVNLMGSPFNSQIFRSAGYPVVLQGTQTLLTLPETFPIKKGVYDTVKFRINNNYSLKAWANADGKTCYTRSTDIHCIVGETNPTNFDDYDFYHYDFMYFTTSTSANSPSITNQFETKINQGLTVNNENETLDLKIIIDTYQLTAFWDGIGQPFLEPFIWSNNYGLPRSIFFPENLPHFGVTYIPFFLSINDPGIPQGEIYKVSDLESDLDESQYTTVLFSSDGHYVGSSVTGTGPLYMVNGLFSVLNNGYTFANGNYSNNAEGVWADRIVNGFKRVSVGDIFSATLTNGPDCGNGILNSTRPCLTENQTIYFKRYK